MTLLFGLPRYRKVARAYLNGIEARANIQSLLETARGLGVRIAYTQDTHFEEDQEWEIWPEHCRAGSWGWEIIK